MDADQQDAVDAHQERLARRGQREAEQGRRIAGRTPKGPPQQVPPQTRVNISDPDPRSVRTQRGFIQGYNAQAAATTDQVIIAAEILGQGNDYGLLEPVIDAAHGQLRAAGVADQINVLLADAGYWASEQIENLAACGTQPLVPPDSDSSKNAPGANRKGPR
jgi:hypothetical protein